ncbi:hypothetical protein DTO282F9_3347 [Paecilomyces variotii]|nr:hypothetical protein DTO282E5_7261 [Paecilomyces variotii]KAJ9399733.1 hypothetical protein DTO282F9_3347 [Paecilomyces variotii]
MPRYDDFRSSTGSLDPGGARWDAERFTRERQERAYNARAPPVVDRPYDAPRRRMEDDFFESRFVEEDRYGPPARRLDRHYDDDHLVRPAGPLVAYDRRYADGPLPRPGLLRRQSSLDSFDRPPRKFDEYYRDSYRVPVTPLRPPRRPSPPRFAERDYYEDVRIADPDHYGDEEYRDIRERERTVERRRPRSDETLRERMVREVEIEKPYPRKGKTRMPRRLVHTRAILELGYPFIEEGDMIIIEKALAKEQIDEVVSLSREIKRRTEIRTVRTSPSPVRSKRKEKLVEKVVMESDSPRSSHETLIIERSPSRHRSHSRVRSELIEKREVREASRPRSVSVHRRRRRSSPMRVIEKDDVIIDDNRHLQVIVPERHRRSDRDIRAEIEALEAEQKALQLERRTRDVALIRDTEISDREEVLEVKRDRRAPSARLIRAMLATVT